MKKSICYAIISENKNKNIQYCIFSNKNIYSVFHISGPFEYPFIIEEKNLKTRLI